jgi:RNA polymerase sigma-70 factor (ECF subfamily)
MSALDVETQGRPAALLGDAELIARIRAGDETACESLYLAYHVPLWRFAYGYTRSRDDAEELVQDVFLELWRGRARWTVQTCVRAWLYAAVRNHARNHLRHERVVARLSVAAADRAAEHGAGGVASAETRIVAMGAPAPDAQASVEAQELDEAVARALAALPERRRLAMTLRWKHDLAPHEIARVLNTTPESVRVLLTRARHELAAFLGRTRGK